MLCNTLFLLDTYICVKKRSFLSFCIVYLSFFKSETSLNYSTFDQQGLIKIIVTNSNDSCDVIVTLYDVISVFTIWKLNKLGINCELSKYLLGSIN